MAKKGQKFKRYSEELKQKAVDMYEQQGISCRQIAKELGVRHKTRIQQWVKKARNGKSFADQRGKIATRNGII